MHWPDIFFKAKKPQPQTELPPAPDLPPPFEPAEENANPLPPAPRPPTIKPVPVSAAPQATMQISTLAARKKTEPVQIAPVGTGTRTLPAMHGVVLRPPTRVGTAPVGQPTAAPPRPPEPLKNIEQLMAEADPVRTLGQTGSVRMLKRTGPDGDPISPAPSEGTPAKPLPLKDPSVLAPTSVPMEASASTPPPFPSFQPAAQTSPPLQIKRVEPNLATPIPVSSGKLVPAPTDDDSPFILKPAASATNAPRVLPPTPPSLDSLGSIFRRKAKLADVARIVLPPKREESEPAPARPESSPTVVPPAFPVAAMTARVGRPGDNAMGSSKASTDRAAESALTESIDEIPAPKDVRRIDPETPVVTETTRPSIEPMPLAEEKTAAAMSDLPEAPKNDFKPEGSIESGNNPVQTSPTPAIEEKPAENVPPLIETPKVDPEAHRPEPSVSTLPKVDPEAHRPPPVPAPPMPSTELSPPAAKVQQEKREFHLANGERVAGVVLSETPEAVYIDHGTLGVITIPRAQIAKRLVEIILINGDRIVGDIMAETADTLYVRHASLGMLTVPRAQRSTRVVEAILKDGDRILGEVLTETDSFTVIRSATLGTVTVPHSKVAMLNRKIEQIELKSLPPPAPELKDKPSG